MDLAISCLQYEAADFVTKPINHDILDAALKRIDEKLAMMPESSFLVWIDFSGLGLSNDALRKLIIEKAGLGLNDGPTFGPGGEGHQRINVGCPRSLVVEAMDIRRCCRSVIPCALCRADGGDE